MEKNGNAHDSVRYSAESNEDLMEYIKRSKDRALDCYDHYEEKTLVEMCVGNIIMEYRAVQENLEIS